MAFFQDNLGKPAAERQTILDFNEARVDGWQGHQLDRPITRVCVCSTCSSNGNGNHFRS